MRAYVRSHTCSNNQAECVTIPVASSMRCAPGRLGCCPTPAHALAAQSLSSHPLPLPFRALTHPIPPRPAPRPAPAAHTHATRSLAGSRTHAVVWREAAAHRRVAAHDVEEGAPHGAAQLGRERGNRGREWPGCVRDNFKRWEEDRTCQGVLMGGGLVARKGVHGTGCIQRIKEPSIGSAFH